MLDEQLAAFHALPAVDIEAVKHSGHAPARLTNGLFEVLGKVIKGNRVDDSSPPDMAH